MMLSNFSACNLTLDKLKQSFNLIYSPDIASAINCFFVENNHNEFYNLESFLIDNDIFIHFYNHSENALYDEFIFDHCYDEFADAKIWGTYDFFYFFEPIDKHFLYFTYGKSEKDIINTIEKFKNIKNFR